MARPREFDEASVLDAAVECFWGRSFEATSLRDLIEQTGVAGASLYNAFGDKRALYGKALDHYVGGLVADRIRRCQGLPALEAISAFLNEVVNHSLNDKEHRGCLLVNSALEVAPHDPVLREKVAGALLQIEAFFRSRVEAGQADGTITAAHSAKDLARHLLGVLMGIRVLARVRPEPALLRGVVEPALTMLENTNARESRASGRRAVAMR